MKKETWSELEISAYLDGELDPQAHAAFEAALAQDADLRQQVEELRQVVQVVRAAPLREPPQNYLLTPSMVAETTPEPKSRRKPTLLLMRLVTSLTAAAFVVTMGLNILSQGLSPETMTQPGVTEPAIEAQTEEPMILMRRSEDQEAMMLESAPVDERPANGVGGGAAFTEEAEPTRIPHKDDQTEELPEQVHHSDEQFDGTPKTAPASPDPEEWASPEITAAEVPQEGLAPAVGPSPPIVPFPPKWLAGLLGILTLILAGVTYGLSRRA